MITVRPKTTWWILCVACRTRVCCQQPTLMSSPRLRVNCSSSAWSYRQRYFAIATDVGSTLTCQLVSTQQSFECTIKHAEAQSLANQQLRRTKMYMNILLSIKIKVSHENNSFCYQPIELFAFLRVNISPQTIRWFLPFVSESAASSQPWLYQEWLPPGTSKK